MKRIYIFITCCIAGVIGTGISMAFGLHWSCMIGTIIFVVAIALSLDSYYRERREADEKFIADIKQKDKTLVEFMSELDIDETRAQKLYQAGFKSIADFKSMSLGELMQIEDINPTLAKRIMQKAQKA